MPAAAFWREKRLDQMTDAEWESLCDGCAKCCLVKLQDDQTEEVAYTRVACALLDLASCHCTDYPNRQAKVPNCIKLTPARIAELSWMPSTCAYRLVAEGRDLYWWHPLVSGDPRTVHQAGMSVHGRVLAEAEVAECDLEEHIVEWPE